MGRVESSVEIEAPVEKVFAFFSNPKNHEKIFVDYNLKMEDVSDLKGVGTKYRVSATIAGMKVKPHWHETVEFEKNRKIVDREVKGGGGNMKKEELTIAFGATDKGTKVTMTLDYKLPYSIIGEVIDKLKLRKGMEIYLKGGAQKAKEILEAT